MKSSYKDLLVWQKSHQFVLNIYKISSGFPPHEQFGMTQQIRRASYSIPANIVEGCERKYKAELVRFAKIAKGSLGETEYFLLLAKDLEYIDEEVFTRMSEECNEIGRMLNGLIKSLK